MSAAHDPDELTRPEAVALYRKLEQRAAALRPGPARPRLPVRRWVVLAPVAAGLAVVAAVATHSLTAGGGGGGIAPPGVVAPANGPLIATGQLPLIPGERVRSIAHHGGATTIHYRSGLVEVIAPRGAPAAVGTRSLGLTLGGRRIVLSGLDPAHLRRALGALEGPQP
jgi:hypothetical protein